MENHVLIIAGALIVGYAIATALKNNEIRQTDCEVLKQKYESNKSNYILLIVAIIGIILLFAGISK